MMRGITCIRTNLVQSRRFASTYQMIKSDQELKQLVSGPGNKVLYFTASWCPPCRMIAPIFDKFSKEFTNVKFAKIDIDENSDSAANYGIRSVPTFIFVENQKIKTQVYKLISMILCRHQCSNILQFRCTVRRCQ